MPCGSKYFSVSTALGGELFYEYGLQPHNSNIIVDFFSKINVFPVHDLAERDSRRRAGDGREERRSCDGRRVDTAVLAAVGNDIYRNELQG